VRKQKVPGGLSGVAGGVLSVPHLRQLLDHVYLPASLSTPPGSKGSGNRGVVVKTTSPYVKTVNGQSGEINLSTPTIQVAILSLAGGTVTWTFTEAFNYVPIVPQPGAIGAPPVLSSEPAVLYISGSPTTTAVVINSTVATDTRQIMCIAVGNPS
jgi:hypothetical protein